MFVKPVTDFKACAETGLANSLTTSIKSWSDRLSRIDLVWSINFCFQTFCVVLGDTVGKIVRRSAL